MLQDKLLEKNRKEGVRKEALGNLKDLGLDFDYLKNKLTLDVGAGSAAIAEEAKRKGIEVLSLDINPEMWTERGMNLPDVPYIKASAEKLPFTDEMFDLIISHAGPFSTVSSKKMFTKILIEAKRVLKKGGELRFGPGNINANIFMTKELFTHIEAREFTTEQRIERIGQKSLQFLKAIDSNINQEVINEPSHDFPSKHFYILKKITGMEAPTILKK